MYRVIKNVRVIDGTGRDPIDQGVILIEDERIAAVGSESEVTIPTQDVTIVDGEGRTALPGLFDCHANMVGYSREEEPYGATQKNIASSIIRGVANGHLSLASGITTVRVDTSGHHGTFALKEAYAKKVLDGPRLLVPGRAICMTGGHGWNYGNHEADGAEEVRKAAREELKAGADWIKLMVTGGAGSPTEAIEENQLTLEEVTVGVAEAHKKGKFAFAHVSCAEGARNCVTAGIDSIEHGLFLEEDIVRDMQAKGIFLVPTLAVYRGLVENGKLGKIPQFMYERALKAVTAHTRSYHMALEAGVKIAAGTDSGQYWFPMGKSLLKELEIMNEEGMSPMETIISATSRAAELLRLTDICGSLVPGKMADVLIVDENPLDSISNLHTTWKVFKEGRQVFAQ